MAGEGDVMLDFLYEMWAYQYPKVAFGMLILWLTYLKSKVECTVDFGWVMNQFIVGFSLCIQYYKNVNYRGWVEFGILCFWFLLLGGMLFFRVISGYKDQRYLNLAESSKSKALYFLFQYELQAVLATLTSTPLYFVFRAYGETSVRWTFIVGASLSVIGILGEHIADTQLRNYKQAKSEQKKKQQTGTQEQLKSGPSEENKPLLGEDPRFPGVLKSGLWSKSRHPNLFFELVIWFGFAVAGLNDFTISFVGFFGPIFLFYIMNNLTVPLTEKHMASTRAYWKEYEKETNKFLPFF